MERIELDSIAYLANRLLPVGGVGAGGTSGPLSTASTETRPASKTPSRKRKSPPSRVAVASDAESPTKLRATGSSSSSSSTMTTTTTTPAREKPTAKVSSTPTPPAATALAQLGAPEPPLEPLRPDWPPFGQPALMRDMQSLVQDAQKAQYPMDDAKQLADLRGYLADRDDPHGVTFRTVVSLCAALFSSEDASRGGPRPPVYENAQRLCQAWQARDWTACARSYDAVRKEWQKLGVQLNQQIRTHAGPAHDLVRHTPMHDAAGIALVYKGRVLMAQFDATGGWCPIGGKAEGSETPWETARREFREETMDAVLTPDEWKAVDQEAKRTQYVSQGRYMLYLLDWGSHRDPTQAVQKANQALVSGVGNHNHTTTRGRKPTRLDWVLATSSKAEPNGWSTWAKQLFLQDVGVQRVLQASSS